MHIQPPPDPARPGLTPTQRSRRDLAAADLTMAREADLIQLEPATLVLLLERLRSALTDTLRLVEELSQ